MQLGQSQRVGFGRSPALIVVDMARSLTDSASPRFVPRSRDCLTALCRLLAATRQRGLPRFFTRNGLSFHTQKTFPLTDAERGSWAFKNAVADRIQDPSLFDLAPELERRPEEIVITKTKPSAFFCTPLIAYLNQMGVDTLIIGGMMTSDCVRCTVVDAFQYNFRVIVPLEGVADRRLSGHENSLEDIDLKYADVLGVDQIINRLQEDIPLPGAG